MSAYPWIKVHDYAPMFGMKYAHCDICKLDSAGYQAFMMHFWVAEHAEKCHPRWTVRKGDCQFCMARAAEREDSDYTGRDMWIVSDSHGSQFGCRQEFDEAIKYAQRKAAKFLRGELKWLGADG